MAENNIKAALAMLYLCGCVLTDTKPNAAKLSDTSLKQLYSISNFHSLSAIVCEGLEQLETITAEDKSCLEAFQTAKKKSIRKNLLLDTERERLFSFMEQNGIWYMPLKGVILKDMYPKMGLRQMADNDILFDAEFKNAVRNWFACQGYELKVYDKGNHDVCLKEPVYNFEMHMKLYGELHNFEWCEYYKDIKTRLIKDDDNSYGYHFSDDDFYIYLLTHGFKHFDSSGIGLRFILDLYVFFKNKRSKMNFSYIEKELQILGIADFEHSCRTLVDIIFCDINSFCFEKLSNPHKELVEYFLTSGIYGTLEKHVQNNVKKKGKMKYLLSKLFPNVDVLEIYHPMFKNKWLMPIGWIYRGFRIMTSGCGNAFKEFCTILNTKK